jgi:hypothetical protein
VRVKEERPPADSQNLSTFRAGSIYVLGLYRTPINAFSDPLTAVARIKA